MGFAKDELGRSPAALRAAENPRTCPGVRPRLLREVRTGGDALRSAMIATNVGVVDVARAWRVDEKMVRLVLSGEQPLTHERLRASPLSVRRAYLTAEMANAEDMAPMSRATIERKALHASATCGTLSSVVVDATADGIVDAHELDAIERAAMSTEDAAREVRRACGPLRAGRAGTGG